MIVMLAVVCVVLMLKMVVVVVADFTCPADYTHRYVPVPDSHLFKAVEVKEKVQLGYILSIIKLLTRIFHLHITCFYLLLHHHQNHSFLFSHTQLSHLL